MTLGSKIKPAIAVIGASSMIGSRFCNLSSADFGLIKADLRRNPPVDITDKETLDNLFEKYSFDSVILFSAFTDVDAAEKQRNDKNGIGWRINVAGTNNVIEACAKFNKKLIFTSTDFVFDGENGPYSEDDQGGPNLTKVSWYGITKIEGENEIKKKLSNYIILRLSYPYRGKFPPKDDFAKIILKKFRQKTLFPMFTDQIFTPTFVDDLAPAVKLLLENDQTGTFHLASPQLATPYEFAKELISTFGGDTGEIKKGSLDDLLEKSDVTPRPLKGGLKVEKIAKIGFSPTPWQNGIKEIFSQSNGELI